LLLPQTVTVPTSIVWSLPVGWLPLCLLVSGAWRGWLMTLPSS
jgi:hypothetical protein